MRFARHTYTFYTNLASHVERASSATSSRYDRTTEGGELKEGQWMPDRPGNRLWLDRTSSRKLLPSTSRLINAINARSRPQRAIFVPRPKFRNIEIYIASCPRVSSISGPLFLSSLCDDPTIRKRGAGRTYSINGTSISVMSASLSVPSRVPTCVENEWSGCY